MKRYTLFISILVILLIIPTNVSSDEDFTVSEPDYLVDDFFEYSGYTNIIVNDFKNTLNDEENRPQISILENNDLRINIASIEECELKDYSGLCQRGKTSHFVNLSLSWEFNTTNYLDDQMYVLITTNEESLVPEDVSPWSWTKRVVVVTSIFKTKNGDEHNVERRILTEFTSHTTSSKPTTISVGDSWFLVEEREIDSENSFRENNGLWQKTKSNTTVTSQRLFSADSYDLLNSELGIVPVISVIEGDSNSGNYSIAQLDELGFTRKIESFKNNENIFTSELQDFRYLRTPDLSAKQSTQTGAVCFGIFMISSILFVSVVFVNEYRKQKKNSIKFQEINNIEESNEFDELENKLKMLRDKKDMKAQKQESELKIKLRAFYLQHNPAKLEFLNDIVKQMEENSFGNSKEHLQILNSQLISRYGVDLDGNKIENIEERVDLPESSKKFKEFMQSIIDD